MRGNHHYQSNRDSELVLRQIIREWNVLDGRVLTKKIVNNNLMNFDKTALDSIYASGYLSEMQVLSIKLFLESSGAKSINESNIRTLNRRAKLIREGRNDFLNEGIWDSIKNFVSKGADSLKSGKEKLMNAFSEGWPVVKKLWNGFKEQVKKICEIILSALKKACEKVKDFAISTYQSAKNKIMNVINPDKLSEEHKKNLPGEIELFKKTAEHIDDATLDLFDNNMKKVVAGDVPEGQTPDELESKITAESLRRERNRILSNKKNIVELLSLESRRRRLVESGDGSVHAEDSLIDAMGGTGTGGSVLKKITGWTIKLIGWVFEPASKAIQLAAKKLASNVFIGISRFSKALDGPGVYTFAALTILLAEAVEIIASQLIDHEVQQKYTAILLGLISPAILPFFEAHHQLMQSIRAILALYALTNAFMNLFKALDPEMFGHSEHQKEDTDDLKSKFEKAIPAYKEKFPHRNVPKFEDLDPQEIKTFIQRWSSANQTQNEWSRNRGRIKRNRQ